MQGLTKGMRGFVRIAAGPVGGSVESFVERFRSGYRMRDRLIKDSGIKRK